MHSQSCKLILFVIWMNAALANQAQRLSGVAEVFEPGIISVDGVWDEYISFSPDGTLLSFTRSGEELPHQDRRIYFSEKRNGKWTDPYPAPFSSDFYDRGSSFSPDGNTLFFGSNRPGNRGFDNDSDLWFSSRKFDGTWGEATRMSDVINSSEYNEGHPSLARNNNLYFVRYRRGEETDVYVSKWIDGEYQIPVKLNAFINRAGPDSHCYVDPDERFLIFTPTDKEGGYGAGDIYISYNIDGEWKEAINLGEAINTDLYEYSAKPGPDSRLYFTRAKFGRSDGVPADIYSVKIVNLLRE
ncbi:MAG: hypothetical protein RIM99_14315 [Cyclobacteriaceae bacterium]